LTVHVEYRLSRKSRPSIQKEVNVEGKINVRRPFDDSLMYVGIAIIWKAGCGR